MIIIVFERIIHNPQLGEISKKKLFLKLVKIKSLGYYTYYNNQLIKTKFLLVL